MFQYQSCPFCCKVRAFLDYYGLPYEVIEVNPVMRQQIKFSKLYTKVPILLISNKNNDEQQPEQYAESDSKESQILVSIQKKINKKHSISWIVNVKIFN